MNFVSMWWIKNIYYELDKTNNYFLFSYIYIYIIYIYSKILNILRVKSFFINQTSNLVNLSSNLIYESILCFISYVFSVTIFPLRNIIFLYCKIRKIFTDKYYLFEYCNFSNYRFCFKRFLSYQCFQELTK